MFASVPKVRPQVADRAPAPSIVRAGRGRVLSRPFFADFARMVTVPCSKSRSAQQSALSSPRRSPDVAARRQHADRFAGADAVKA